jgi:hypothetical protein
MDGREGLVVFRDVPAGPGSLEVRLRGQRGPVTVAANGVVLGMVEPGAGQANLALPDMGRGDRRIELVAPAFTAGDGRRLGALLDRVALRHAPARVPSARLLLLFLMPALVTVAAASLSGMGPWSAAALSAALSLSKPLLSGPTASSAPATRSVSRCCSSSASRWPRPSPPGWIGAVKGSGPWAFGAVIAAVLVQGVAATSPLMVVSDAVFHANQLAKVAAGDFFITSVTQHARPFRFPYGVSFYALLAPFARAGLDGVWLVRAGRGGIGDRGLRGSLPAAGRPRSGHGRAGRGPAAAAARHLRRVLLRELVERLRAIHDPRVLLLVGRARAMGMADRRAPAGPGRARAFLQSRRARRALRGSPAVRRGAPGLDRER